MQVRRPPLAVLPVAVILLASLPLRPDSRADDPGTLAPAAASPVAPAPAAPPAVLVFGSDHDFYPFEWLDDSGQPHGLNIDLMRALGRELGFEARFVLGPWSRIRHMFEVEGTIDVSDMFHSEIRGQVVEFVEPYAVVWDQAWVRAGEREIRSLEDLAGLRLLVQDGAYTQEYLQAWGRAGAIIGVESEPMVLDELAAGRGDVGLVTQVSARQPFDRFRHANLRPSGPPLLPRAYGLVVPKGRTDLVEMLDRGMAALRTSGQMEAIERKWLMAPEPPSRVVLFLDRYLRWVLLVVAGLLALGLAYAIRLTRRSRRQSRELAAELAERRRVEDALRSSEHKFATAFWSSPTVMAVSRLEDGRHIDVNEAWVRTFGYSRDEALGHSSVELGLFEAAARQHLVASLKRDGYVHNLEARVRTRAGREIDALLNADVIDLGGEPCVLITITDITELRRWEKALQDSEARWKFALEGAGEGVWDWDVAANRLEASERYREILGLGEVPGGATVDTWMTRLLPEDAARVRAEFEAHARRESPFFQTEARIRAGGGDVRWIGVRGKAIAWGTDGRPVRMIGTIVDVTGRREAEEERLSLEAQLQQAQKMEVVGQLAGGIAHDFNNQLTVIRGYCELLQQEPLEERGIALLIEVVRATERASGLTGKLLAFGRKQVRRLAVVNLNKVVHEMAGALSLMIGEDVRIEIEAAANLGNVRVDRSQMEQVIANIAVNARDAMPGGGKLTIRTRNIVLDEDYVRHHVGATVGPHVMVAFQDTGVGIPPDTMSRMFEPFYTTKGEGQGSGLGLSIVYGIVRQSGGHITVESEVGRGATFKILLPRVYESVTPEVEAPVRETARREAATVMFVEDDANLFTLMSGVIENAGYHTLASSDPLEALRIGLEHPGTIDLLVSDVVMPGMSGPQLAEALLDKRPGLRVLFVSGYPKDVLDRQTVLPPGIRLLGKPFSPRDLLAEIQRAIAAVPPGNGDAATGVVPL
jgi:PAS domain S-box-containing protein